MTLEIALWAAGVATVPLIAFCIWLYVVISRISAGTDEMLIMHRSPDAHGFGTARLERVLDNLVSATNALAHYTTWLAERTTGQKPPPPPPPRVNDKL